MSDRKNNTSVTISRVTNLSESVMKDCYYVIAQGLPSQADEFFYRAQPDVNCNGHILFVAEAPMMVVGVLKGNVISGAYGVRGEIDCLCVDKKYCRRGVGAALLKAYEEYVRVSHGASQIDLKSSSGAINFYRNRGYLGETQYLHKVLGR